MTVYNDTLTTFWQIDSPLNDYSDVEAAIVIDPPAEDPLQQRMQLIIIFVLVGVILFASLVVPQLAAGDESAPETAVVAANAPAVSGTISPIFSPEVQYWAPQIVQWAGQQSLDPDMVATIMQIESCGDPQALSSAGAQGLFQVMPFHFQGGENAFDPDVNARRGMAYFAERLVQTAGDVGKAFAGYNGGHVAAGGSWDTWANETQRYFVWSTGIYQDAKAGLTDSPTLREWLGAGGASLCQQASNRLGLR